MAEKKEELYNPLAEAVTKAVSRHGWTLQELADQLGISYVTLHRWRKGKIQRIPHKIVEELYKLAQDPLSPDMPVDELKTSVALTDFLEEAKDSLKEALRHVFEASARIEAVTLLIQTSSSSEASVKDALPIDALLQRAKASLGEPTQRSLRKTDAPDSGAADQGLKSA